MIVNDPRLLARAFLAEIDHPAFGKIHFPQGALASIAGTVLRPAPRLGEHNQEILGRRTVATTEAPDERIP